MTYACNISISICSFPLLRVLLYDFDRLSEECHFSLNTKCVMGDCAALLSLTFAALSPHWDTHMNFKISTPELSLIRFCVRDQTGLLSSEFVGQYTLPFTSLMKGEPRSYRRVRGGSRVMESHIR